MSSQYPSKADLFTVKHNAISADDTAGDYVMAEDINNIQDSITSIQNALGLNPQGSYANVGDRVARAEATSIIRIPPILFYLGAPGKINGAVSTDEATGYYLKYDYVILADGNQDPAGLNYNDTTLILSKTKAVRNVRFYGYMDVSIPSVTVSQIQAKIAQWNALGVEGIFCDNYGYDSGVSRTKQNQILDSIHQYNMKAILSCPNPDNAFSNTADTIYNPDWTAPKIVAGDAYFFDKFAVDTSANPVYTNSANLFTKINSLITYRSTLSIKIFGGAFIQDAVVMATAQGYFDYTHALGILCSLDGFGSYGDNRGAVGNAARFYDWSQTLGSWYAKAPYIIHSIDGNTHTRQTGFGSIVVDTLAHTFVYNGQRLLPNSIDANVIKDGTLDGTKVVTSINASTAQIELKNIKNLIDNTGGISGSLLQANTISAINASIGAAQIGAAKIVDLDASKITAGTIAAGRISGSVVAAVNLYAATMAVGDATLASAAIGTLSVQNMSANVIDAVNISVKDIAADRIKANVIQAVNLSAVDIAADRMRANVVSAINIYSDTITVETAKIKSAAIGQLTADRIQVAVVDAINANIGTATINSSRIGVLSVSSMQAAVLSAINASVETAKINKAKIGQLDATNLEANSVTATQIAANSVDASKIVAGSITATQIAANTITAAKIAAGTITATEMAANTITAAQIAAGTITAAQIAANTITAAKIAAGTITSTEIAAAAITATQLAANSVIAGKIAANAVTASTIAADAVIAGNIAANAITTRELATDSVQARNILAGTITADKITANSITAAQIAAGTITATQIAAATITASQLAANSVTATQISAGSVIAGKLAADSIAASNIQADAVTATKILAGSIQTTHMTAASINGDRITVATLNGDRITARSIDAGQLKVGTITAVEIAAGTITANQIAANTITTNQIAAGSITSNLITTVGLDAQIVKVYNAATGEVLIGGGFIRVDGFDMGVPLSDNLITNGIFLTASSSFGLARDNQAGEVILGSQTSVAGGHQVWKIDLTTNAVTNKIDIAGKRPTGIAIDEYGDYGYVTVQGDDTIVQINLAQNVVTSSSLKSGMGPGVIKYVGADLADHKHLFALATDPDDMSIPDAFMVIDGPRSSVNNALYMHHLIPLGNNPYDFVMDSNHFIYVTMGTSGDIVVIDANPSSSMYWKVVGRIPIASYMSDNYHGGLPGDFGLGLATGGSASIAYQLAADPMAGMHSHGGYAGATGIMRSYEARGIALSADTDHLYVVDHKNNQLVVVDKTGKAPYNSVTGTREPNNAGALATPPQTSGTRDYTNTNGETYYVRYRINIGNAPEMVSVVDGKIIVTLTGQGQIAVITESDILNAISADRTYYATWNNTMAFNTKPVITPRFIDVGSKPTFIKVFRDTVAAVNKVFVTVNGQNQIVEINQSTEAVARRVNVGANPMMMDVSPDGKFLYIANQGGTGNLTFIYPKGPFKGDAYLGLEGMVQHHGGQGWVPNRTDWVKDVNGNVIASAVVEFRINEPLMNEGGYVRLSAQGKTNQWAQIEQDITGVTNYSNGNSPAGTWFRSHNGSVQVAIANGTSPNFSTQFEIDEFVPRVVVYDCLQTDTFTPTADGITDSFTGLEYSWITNRAIGKTATSSVAPTTGAMTIVTDNNIPESLEGDMTTYIGAANITTSTGTIPGTSTYITLPSGLQSVTVDLGAKYMVNKVSVCHMFNVDRKYKATKTEVSEDNVTWYTIFDSAVPAGGEYPEVSYHSTHGHTHYGKVITMPNAKVVRYVRDWCNGWANAAATVTGTDNTWAEIRVYGDWQLEETYRYPARTDKAGLQVATNGKGFITTDVSGAWIAVNLDIKFTCWSWMTFIAGPEFGTVEISMPTLMNTTHYVTQVWPYLTNLPHRHTMAFTPSSNIKADAAQGIVAGKHRLIIKQDTGKVSIDRLRFDDFQYYMKSSTLVPNTASAVFQRYKIVSEQAKSYVGQGRQATEGPYDEPRKNPNTHAPDNSVPIKYRFRVKSSLNANGTLDEQGVAYVSSAIFETGKLSSFWRMSQSQDLFPATRIETFDPMQPHNTGIQSQHLAFGSVNGNILLANSVMNHHISNYARISEHKLNLNFPTHDHTNKVMLDQITGWGTSGTAFTIARGDHTHAGMLTVSGTATNNMVPIWISGSASWGQLNIPVAQLTDITTYYYNKSQVDAKFAGPSGGGTVYTNTANNFSDTNTFSKPGLGILIQPTAGAAEVASLQITNATGATTAGNVTVTLDGVATNVALLTSDNTPTLVATKIRAAAFTGWTTGGSADTVTFTAMTVGNKVDATYSAGTTGATGTIITATQGAPAPATGTVLFNIANTAGVSQVSTTLEGLLTANTLSISSTATITGLLTLGAQATGIGHAVRADRLISTGAGLLGGGDLTADRTISISYGGDGVATTVSRSDHSHSNYISSGPNQTTGTGFTVGGALYLGTGTTSGDLIVKDAAGTGVIHLDGDSSGKIAASSTLSYIAGNGNASFTGTVSIGTLAVTATTLVTNLNAERINSVAELDLAKNLSFVDDSGYGVFMGLAVSQHSPTPDFSLDIAAGTVYTNTGRRIVYPHALFSSNIALQNPNASFNRIDVLYVQGSAGGANEGRITVMTGTPASPAVEPSIPADAVKLAVITVRMNSTAVVNTDIADARVWRPVRYNGTNFVSDKPIMEGGVLLTNKYVQLGTSGVPINNTLYGRQLIQSSGNLSYGGGTADATKYYLKITDGTNSLLFDPDEIVMPAGDLWITTATGRLVLNKQVEVSNSGYLRTPKNATTLTWSGSAWSSANSNMTVAGTTANTVTLTHNYGATSYAVTLTPNVFNRHIAWANKAANTIDILVDEGSTIGAGFSIDVVLIGY